MQFPGVGIGGARDKGLVGAGDVEGLQVWEDGLGHGQEQGQEPDERRLQDDAGRGAGRLDVQGLHDGSVSGTFRGISQREESFKFKV